MKNVESESIQANARCFKYFICKNSPEEKSAFYWIMEPLHEFLQYDFYECRHFLVQRSYYSQGGGWNELVITKPCTHLHPASSTSTQLHPAPPSSFQSPLNSLQHPQEYLNQNIASKWAISPNLGQKIKSCPFRLKIGTQGILEVLILNPDLDFWNSDPKIHFWPNLGPKIHSCLFCLKTGAHSISGMLIPNPDLDFWHFDHKIYFWANLGPKTESCPFCLKIGTHSISRMLIPNPDFDFWNFDPKIHFWANLDLKIQSCPFCLKTDTHGVSKMMILIPTLAL